jgi:anti-sigma-K factor RskA
LNEGTTQHDDLGTYLAGRLDPEERRRFERHLAECPQCRQEAEELGRVTSMLERRAPAYEVPAGLEARTIEAVRAAAPTEPRRAPDARPRGRRALAPRLAGAVAVAAGLALAVFAGIEIAEDDDEGARGVLEVSGVMRAPGAGDQTGEAAVRMLGIGREIAFRSDELKILPTGEFYELWFVAPSDRPGRPNRISAGTFHPDENGRSDVDFTAAVDPAKFPVLEITAEPGDGNPARTGPVVLRLDASKQVGADR